MDELELQPGCGGFLFERRTVHLIDVRGHHLVACLSLSISAARRCLQAQHELAEARRAREAVPLGAAVDAPPALVVGTPIVSEAHSEAGPSVPVGQWLADEAAGDAPVGKPADSWGGVRSPKKDTWGASSAADHAKGP